MQRQVGHPLLPWEPRTQPEGGLEPPLKSVPFPPPSSCLGLKQSVYSNSKIILGSNAPRLPQGITPFLTGWPLQAKCWDFSTPSVPQKANVTNQLSELRQVASRW